MFAGDYTSEYVYSISEEDKSITISGDIKNIDGETIIDKFATYEIVKLSKKELRIKRPNVMSDIGITDDSAGTPARV